MIFSYREIHWKTNMCEIVPICTRSDLESLYAITLSVEYMSQLC